MKDDYINAIKGAGFMQVEVIDQIKFPVELMTNDPTVREVVARLNIPEDEVTATGEAIASIKIYAVKPGPQ